MTRHIQNPAMEHYSAIFWYIQNVVQRLHTQKPSIRGILDAYSGPCHINENLQIFRTRTYLKPDIYLELSQRFETELFANIVALHLRSLTRF